MTRRIDATVDKDESVSVAEPRAAQMFCKKLLMNLGWKHIAAMTVKPRAVESVSDSGQLIEGTVITLTGIKEHESVSYLEGELVESKSLTFFSSTEARERVVWLFDHMLANEVR